MRLKYLSTKKILFSFLTIGLITLLYFWILYSPSRQMTWVYPDSQFYAATLLRGDAQFSEIAQDAYGFRAMLNRWNAYLPLSLALPNIHENWNLPTTHPPTAFLFAAPVAFFSDAVAATIWAWICLAALYASLRLHGFNWVESILFTLLSLLWLPTIGSLGQLTPIWLLGLSLGYFFRDRNPSLAGVFIALASMTKFFPALLIIPFLIKRKLAAFYSFILVWTISLIFIFILSPDIFNQYFQANITASPHFVKVSANFIYASFRTYGVIGLLPPLAILLLIFLSNWKDLYRSKDLSTKSWMVFSLMAVALFPVIWGYSYFPLYPGMIMLSKEKRPARIFGIMGLIFSSSPIPAIGMVLYGLGLAWPTSIIKVLNLKCVKRNRPDKVEEE